MLSVRVIVEGADLEHNKAPANIVGSCPRRHSCMLGSKISEGDSGKSIAKRAGEKGPQLSSNPSQCDTISTQSIH